MKQPLSNGTVLPPINFDINLLNRLRNQNIYLQRKLLYYKISFRRKRMGLK